jgi:arsenate reductase
MLKIYGLANCDKTQAFIKQTKAKQVEFVFIDFKVNPPTKEQITNWCSQKSWTLILNKRSTTWKSLSAETQDSITSEAKAVELMLLYPTLIKRPIVEKDGKLLP